LARIIGLSQIQAFVRASYLFFVVGLVLLSGRSTFACERVEDVCQVYGYLKGKLTQAPLPLIRSAHFGQDSRFRPIEVDLSSDFYRPSSEELQALIHYARGSLAKCEDQLDPRVKSAKTLLDEIDPGGTPPKFPLPFVFANPLPIFPWARVACPKMATTEQWEEWAAEQVVQLLGVDDHASGLSELNASTARELLAEMDDPSPLLKVLAGHSIKKFQVLGMIQAPAVLPGVYSRDWNSWIRILASPMGAHLSEERLSRYFQVSLGLATERPGVYPLPLIPPRSDVLENLKRELTSNFAGNLKASPAYLSCLKSTENGAPKNCYTVHIQPSLVLAKPEIEGQVQALKPILYQQVSPASVRGFPYGFESYETYVEFSEELQLGVSQKLSEVLSEDVKVSGGALEGSSASGLSFSEVGGVRTAFSRSSDFDTAIFVAEELFKKIVTAADEAVSARSGSPFLFDSAVLRAGSPFGFDSAELRAGSPFGFDSAELRASSPCGFDAAFVPSFSGARSATPMPARSRAGTPGGEELQVLLRGAESPTLAGGGAASSGVGGSGSPFLVTIANSIPSFGKAKSSCPLQVFEDGRASSPFPKVAGEVILKHLQIYTVLRALAEKHGRPVSVKFYVDSEGPIVDGDGMTRQMMRFPN